MREDPRMLASIQPGVCAARRPLEPGEWDVEKPRAAGPARVRAASDGVAVESCRDRELPQARAHPVAPVAMMRAA